jgi:hypothetical protein
MSSDAQIKANRANAQLSTGPKSEDGKNKIAQNAVKTGLTGRTVLLPTDDVEQYRRHCERILAQLNPRTERERSLADSIAETEWRLLRIPVLESSIYAVGRRLVASQFADEEDPAVRASLVEGQVHLTYEKQLRNLAIQERRLRRQRQEDQAELARLQELRRSAMHHAARHLDECEENGEEFRLEEFGFEITKQEIDAEVAHLVSRRSGPYNALRTVATLQWQIVPRRPALTPVKMPMASGF